MSLTEKLLWHVEMSLHEPVTLNDLADRCATSPTHLSRAFQASSGHAPMGYLRARRLSLAAKTLAGRKADILSVALDAQFSSHEAFTRAFQRQFGCAPRDITDQKTLQNLNLTEPLKMDKSMITDVADPRFEDAPAMHIIGLSNRFHRETIVEIPAMWAAFNARLSELEEADLNTAYGVSCDPNQDGTFRYTAGVAGPKSLSVPDGMATVALPAGRYAVFAHEGHISDFARTVYTIWNKALSDAGLTTRAAPDFELYDARFNAQTGRGTVEIWIPVV